MIRPPPRSSRTYTRLPYTTLFRSETVRSGLTLLTSFAPFFPKFSGNGQVGINFAHFVRSVFPWPSGNGQVGINVAHFVRSVFPWPSGKDRKSTRLNSSH